MLNASAESEGNHSTVWASSHPTNGTGGDEYYSTLRQPTHMIVVYSVAYSLIFLAAVVGNVMVVIVVAMTPRMRSVTNLFIANLAVADILVAVFCIPITLLDNIFAGWPFGAALCKLTPYIQGVSVCASVYSLAAIAVDRLLAICFNPRWRILKRGACVILVMIWLFSFGLIVPWLVYYQHWARSTAIQTVYFCHPIWPDYNSQKTFYVLAIFIGTYLLPLSVVFVCYLLVALKVWNRQAPGVATGNGVIHRCKVNVIKMLITVVAVFAFSWLPLHVIYLLFHFDPPEGDVLQRFQNIGLPLAQWLELSNSGMNAIIYSFFSGNFRRGFLHICSCVRKRRKPPRGRRAGSCYIACPRPTTISVEASFITERGFLKTFCHSRFHLTNLANRQNGVENVKLAEERENVSPERLSRITAV